MLTKDYSNSPRKGAVENQNIDLMDFQLSWDNTDIPSSFSDVMRLDQRAVQQMEDEQRRDRDATFKI